MLEVSSVIPSEEAHRFLEEELVDSPFTLAMFLTFWQSTQNHLLLKPTVQGVSLSLTNGGLEIIGRADDLTYMDSTRARLTITKGRPLKAGHEAPSRLETMLYIGEIVGYEISKPFMAFRGEDIDFLNKRVGNIDPFSFAEKGLFLNDGYHNWCWKVFAGLRSNAAGIPQERFDLKLPKGF